MLSLHTHMPAVDASYDDGPKTCYGGHKTLPPAALILNADALTY